MDKWLTLAQLLAPAILATVPGGAKIAPFVPVITTGIQEARQIPGASNEEKKAHVMGLAMAAFSALQATGKIHLGTPEDFQSTVSAGIDTTVGVINIAHRAHEAVPTGVLLPPAPASTAGQ